ncbi:PREDICTED: uncharacterized protein LOC109212983 [Nicotiana attenuata]|uniref:uncharacterized protein LOC109212983 n=1 Tax=Nicotiana attenuata TaxID=49451 RepID=UPI000904E5C4|nr:PREDICTED: uncharacterized protein LOC109212983 [Nicotiana attenuata]
MELHLNYLHREHTTKWCAERRNRTLMGMVRSMLSYSDLSLSFWGYALEIANYILNLVPSKSVPSTPMNCGLGESQVYGTFGFGVVQHMWLKGKADKLESRTEVSIFIGYPKGTKGGLFYCPKEKKVIVTTNARFLEEDYLTNHIPRSKLVLQELNNGITNDSTLERIPEASIDIPLHYRSGRNVNRHQIVQKQLPDISLPQSSGNNVEQPQIVEQPHVVEQPKIVMQPEESKSLSRRGPGVTAVGPRQNNAPDSAGPSDRGPGVTAVGPRQNSATDSERQSGRDPALHEEVNDILAPLLWGK